MSKDPAILFYTADFITGTLTMSDEQVGKYIRLLCLQHQKGFLTEKDMLNICKTYDEDIYQKFEKNGEGKYINNRMNEEILRRKAYSESRRINRKGAKTKEKSSKKHMNNICKSYVEHMETENITEDINITEDKLLRKEAKFKSEVYEFIGKYPDSMLKEFISYWTEPNKSKTKLRYELQPTWDLGRRLSTWANRNKDFKPKQKEKQISRSTNYERIIQDEGGAGEVPDFIKKLAEKKKFK